MKIVLLGYMASGKSLIGKRLADILKYDFIDLDAFIEKEEKKSITEIFSEKSEIYFRKIENKYLKQVLNSSKKYVLSLGGGTPCYANNMKILHDDASTKTFYLKTAILTIVERLKNENEKRPLVSHLKSDEEFVEFVGKHLFERSQFYSQANYTINADENTEEIIEEIISCLF